MPGTVADLEQHRAALTGHCYRMLGSAMDADDAVQETMVQAWTGLPGFEGKSPLGTWLVRIATRVCLDALSSYARRERPVDGPVGSVDGELGTRERAHWLEPIPDVRVIRPDATPAQQVRLRASIRLPFVAALQYLPPKQRAALLMTDVLECTVADAAETLDSSVASVTSAIQRGRETLAARDQADALKATPMDDPTVLTHFAGAFERFDLDALTSLLGPDVALSMPPHSLWLQGPEAVRGWWMGRGKDARGSRLVATAACGSPAFGQYRDGGRTPWALIVLELANGQITSLTSFEDTAVLFPLFRLSRDLTL